MAKKNLLNEITNKGKENDAKYNQELATITDTKAEELKVLAKSLSIKDLASVREFGSELGQAISENGDALLSSVRDGTTNSVVELTNQLIAELDTIDLHSLEDTPWHRLCKSVKILNRFAPNEDAVLASYDSIKDVVDDIAKKIQLSKMESLRDNSTLENLYFNTETYIQQTHDLILAAKAKLAESTDELNVLKSENNGQWSPEAQNLEMFNIALSKRITDMETMEYMFVTNLMQIRATQSNNNEIANRADAIATQIIPIWRYQLCLSATLKNQRDAVASQKAVADAMNTIIKNTSDKLRANTEIIAQESKRNNIDLSVLKDAHENIVTLAKEMEHLRKFELTETKNIEDVINSYVNKINEN